MFTANAINIMIHPLILGFIIAVIYPKMNERFSLIAIYTWSFLSFASLFAFFYENIIYNKIFVVKFFDIIMISDFNVSFDVAIDSATFIMLFIVSYISYCVMMFAFWYMKGDPNFSKFIAFLSFFSFFMLVLVAANNIIVMFLGWEGIGLFSYLLINFWNTRLNANRSALKAIVFNKIGDCFFYLFIIAYCFIFESVNVFDVKQIFNSYANDDNILFNIKFVYFLAFCLILAGMAKSAQVILHVWLPDAMEGPTPVSALLHAATMVTAGIYLLIKFNWLVFYNEQTCCFIVLVGVFTNLLASFTALFQHDIKKIIAYSTASQLGLIFITFGSLKFNLAIFHIFNHAFFKALLFILAGYTIHALKNKQDLRAIFKLNHSTFFVYISLLISSLTLVGFPYFSAFYSKDFIVNYSFINFPISKTLVFFFLMLSMMTTFLYTFKIAYFLFYSNQANTFSSTFSKNFLSESKKFFSEQKLLSLYLIICALLLFSIFGGYVFSSYFHFDFLTTTWMLDLEINLEKKNSLPFLEMSFLLIIFMIAYTIPFVLIKLVLIKYNLIFSKFWGIFYFFNKKTLYDNFYYVVSKVFLLKSSNSVVILDKIVIEYFITFFVKTSNKIIEKIKNLYANLRWWVYVLLLIMIAGNLFLYIMAPAVFGILVIFFFSNIMLFVNVDKIFSWWKK